jgi:hypothetical protein
LLLLGYSSLSPLFYQLGAAAPTLGAAAVHVGRRHPLGASVDACEALRAGRSLCPELRHLLGRQVLQRAHTRHGTALSQLPYYSCSSRVIRGSSR